MLEHNLPKKAGGKWKLVGDRVIFEFNEGQFEFILSKDRKNLIQIEPLNSPPSVATFARALGEPEPEGDHWEAYKDIDMCG